MNDNEIKLIGWLSPDNALKHPEAEFDEKHETLLMAELAKNDYIICGDTHQTKCIPLFTDGVIELSMRRFDEVMTETYKRMNPTKKTPRFYMAALCDISENLPECD